jgi:hypothetical protein
MCLSKESVAHDLTSENAQARSRYWRDKEQVMDPYDRLDFWGKQGYKVVVGQRLNAGGKADLVAANNSQITLEGNDEGCTSIIAMIKSLKTQTASAGLEDRTMVLGMIASQQIRARVAPGDVAGTMDRGVYMRIYANMQATLSPVFDQQKEYIDAVADNKKLDKTLLLMHPTNAKTIQALRQRSINEENRG